MLCKMLCKMPVLCCAMLCSGLVWSGLVSAWAEVWPAGAGGSWRNGLAEVIGLVGLLLARRLSPDKACRFYSIRGKQANNHNPACLRARRCFYITSSQQETPGWEAKHGQSKRTAGGG